MPHLVTLPPLAVALAPFGVGYALGALVRRVGHGVRARRAPAPLTRAQQRGQAGEAAVSAVVRARFTRRATICCCGLARVAIARLTIWP